MSEFYKKAHSAMLPLPVRSALFPLPPSHHSNASPVGSEFNLFLVFPSCVSSCTNEWVFIYFFSPLLSYPKGTMQSCTLLSLLNTSQKQFHFISVFRFLIFSHKNRLHLDCFQYFVITNTAAVNDLVQCVFSYCWRYIFRVNGQKW